MRYSIAFAAILPATLTYALPAAQSWEPAEKTTVTCAKDTKVISFVTPGGFSNGTELAIAVCHAIDPCLYPEDLHPTGGPDDVICAMSVNTGVSKRSIDHSLSIPKSGSVAITALDGGMKVSKNLKVTLAAPATARRTTTYRKEDCEGYLSQLFSEKEGTGKSNGCIDENNVLQMGQLIVGTPSTLSGAQFEATLI